MIGYSDCFRQNILVCLLQDLENAYVYWDFNTERMKNVKSFIENVKSGMHICLRLWCQKNEHDHGALKEEVTLTRIEPGNYYFRNLDPDLLYRFEFGGYDHTGKYILFNRTPLVTLKPAVSDSSCRTDQPTLLPLLFDGQEADFLKIASSWS